MWKFRSGLLIKLPSRRRVCGEERVNYCKKYYKHATPLAEGRQGRGNRAAGSRLPAFGFFSTGLGSQTSGLGPRTSRCRFQTSELRNSTSALWFGPYDPEQPPASRACRAVAGWGRFLFQLLRSEVLFSPTLHPSLQNENGGHAVNCLTALFNRQVGFAEKAVGFG